MKLCKSYQKVSSCMTCLNVFTMEEYDQGNKYYCHSDKSERPFCGSVLMYEGHYIGLSDKESNKRVEAWNEWSSCRQVMENGWCKKYKDNKK